MPDGRSWELWEAESFLFNFASKWKMAGRKRKQRKIIGKVKRNRQRKKRKSERETEAEEGTEDERETERDLLIESLRRLVKRYIVCEEERD